MRRSCLNPAPAPQPGLGGWPILKEELDQAAMPRKPDNSQCSRATIKVPNISEQES